MIHKNTVDAVYDAIRIEEVIGDFVTLKKSGSNFKGLSPFSDERTPSFMVSPVKQIWKDFSSGKGGNAIAFIMEHEHYSYPEAIKYLAKKYNIEVEETEQTSEQKEKANEKESLFLVNEYANQFFQQKLTGSEEGKAIGLTYYKERGFTEDTIKKFELGYSPDLWDAFTNAAIKSSYKLEFLEKTGLTIVKEAKDGSQKTFDRFKGRVMFPIKSLSGRVLGFGGRILTNDKKAAKYLNSPQSEVYDKSKVLYGIYHAKQAIAKEDECYLVEGYTDVIQFHQTGVVNTVSSSGTALTPDQIRLISRLTANITVLFDGDAAGIRASIRGIDLILEQGMNVRICTFPAGEDPDSFARENTLPELKEYLNQNTQDFIQFKASLLQEESKNDPSRKAEMITDMVRSISKIPDAIKKELYVRECARIMEISEEVLFNTLAQTLAGAEREQQKKIAVSKKQMEVVPDTSQPVEKVNPQYELEKKIIEILLLYGKKEEEFEDLVLKENEDGDLVPELEKHTMCVFEKIFLDLQEDEIEFTNETFKAAYNILIEELNLVETFKIENFINKMTPEIASQITEIIMNEEKYELHRWDDKEIHVKQKDWTVARYVSDVILNLRRFLINLKIEELLENFKKDTSISEELNLEEIKQDVMDYTQLKKVLSNKLNRVV
ncbi:DNA primase [Aquimarina sp. ERC-38]|uniref:DNA primase n=1 Tax=Aquimarina sp. ERC-38 TaxID=2949996 RepID=UPI0022473656|nr:DNA primase [Aquimarina sp. ERC-38]UZO82498.1 DNA primase [Aquimarina sp. ERC-38]